MIFIFSFAGNTEKTITEKKNILELFKKWIAAQEYDFDESCKDSEDIQFKLIEYLETYRVKDKETGNLIRPKAGYLKKIQSHLKVELEKLTGM